jgi:biopolymer transport protein ExbD
MAQQRWNSEKRKAQLHSLIDMAFILLIFFLVTSMMAKMGGQEQKLSIPTPENQPGRAQIVIQIISADEYWFLDESARETAEDIFRRYPFLPMPQQIEMIMNGFASAKCDRITLFDKTARLKAVADKNDNSYFVLIRCPDELPYYHVMDIIQALSGSPNIKYGCVGGKLADITAAAKIKIVPEKTLSGERRNLVIEF